jgi:hypothetical protein
MTTFRFKTGFRESVHFGDGFCSTAPVSADRYIKWYDWNSRRTGGAKIPLRARFYDALTFLIPPKVLGLNAPHLIDLHNC